MRMVKQVEYIGLTSRVLDHACRNVRLSCSDFNAGGVSDEKSHLLVIVSISYQVVEWHASQLDMSRKLCRCSSSLSMILLDLYK